MTKQERFESMQARWRKAREKAADIRFALRRQYGEPWYAPKGKRDKLERAEKAEDKASDEIFTWLDQNSPRNWRTCAPAFWICDCLSYNDAVTTGQMKTVPPPAYGYYPSDMVRFSAPIQAKEMAPIW